MRARALAVACALASPAAAHAQDAQPFAPAPPPPALVAPAPAGRGVVVLAVDRATDAAWPLAQAVYGDSGLRPSSLDDATVRALAGEAPAPDAPLRIRELAETRAAIHGDDPASRRLLASLARELGVAAIAVVAKNETAPSCRVFLAKTGQMDIVTLSPDAGEGPLAWKGALEALRSRVPPPLDGPRAEPIAARPSESATTPEQAKPGGSFLSSKWFWGAAVVAGVVGVFFLASRPTGTDPTTVQLHGHVAR